MQYVYVKGLLVQMVTKALNGRRLRPLREIETKCAMMEVDSATLPTNPTVNNDNNMQIQE